MHSNRHKISRGSTKIHVLLVDKHCCIKHFFPSSDDDAAWTARTDYKIGPETSEILTSSARLDQGRAQLRRLDAGFPPRRPDLDPTSGHVGFVADKVALGQGFSEYFDFPCQFSFHRLLHTHLSSGAGAIGQLVADVPSGLRLNHTGP
jgi:hypothetical protein